MHLPACGSAALNPEGKTVITVLAYLGGVAMPLLLNRNPKYRKHRASRQAVVTIDGRDIYLGPWNTKASRAEYDRIISEWLANGRRAAPAGNDTTVGEVVERFWTFAKTYYVHPDGTPTGEAESYKAALRPVLRLYGTTPARDFGPLALEACRLEMIKADWCRNMVNRSVGRVKYCFKWAASKELVPASVYQALVTIAGLRAGKSEARESVPVRPVSDATVLATLPHLSPTLRAMVELQQITGARPGEICSMRTADVDRTGAVWCFKPRMHKTAWLGRERVIFIGPRGQEILRPFLRLNPDAYCFSPAEAERVRREKLSAARVTPLSCGNRPGTNRRRKPLRTVGERYDTTAFTMAIKRACEVAFSMPDELRERPGQDTSAHAVAKRRAARKAWRAANVWHPNQLRHSAGTRIRQEYGLEGAAAVLGHAKVETTQIYAERSATAAREIAQAVG